MNARHVIVAIGVLLGCSACGFKGPLYLPQQNAAVVTHPNGGTAVTAPAVKPATPQSKSERKKKPGGTSSR